MVKFNETQAIKHALELAMAVCSNPNSSIILSEDSANNLADFIRTLEARFRCEDTPAEPE